jgi:dye decolorizing peroxidase
MLVKDARPFASVRWAQHGFRRAAGVRAGTQRNLMGQLDGTTNPEPGTEAFERSVWQGDTTTMVIRRIRVELETWDQLGRTEKEQVIGRRLDSGAPLTGTAEHDPPDFEATDEVGFPVIPDFAHIRRAHVADPHSQMFRRPYHYDGAPDATGQADSGMIFVAYQADIDRQFSPVQRRLAEHDLLNKWITPIGSAVFAIPPGCQPGGWIGEEVLG